MATGNPLNPSRSLSTPCRPTHAPCSHHGRYATKPANLVPPGQLLAWGWPPLPPFFNHTTDIVFLWIRTFFRLPHFPFILVSLILHFCYVNFSKGSNAKHSNKTKLIPGHFPHQEKMLSSMVQSNYSGQHTTVSVLLLLTAWCQGQLQGGLLSFVNISKPQKTNINSFWIHFYDANGIRPNLHEV